MANGKSGSPSPDRSSSSDEKAKSGPLSPDRSSSSDEKAKSGPPSPDPPKSPLDDYFKLYEDPRIKKLAKSIAKDSSFDPLAEQLQKTLQGDVPQFDEQQSDSTMLPMIRNPQLMTMVHQLEEILAQDQTLSSKEESPSMELILDELQKGGSGSMMRYLNNKDVLRELCRAMDFSIAGDEGSSGGNYESILHTAASVGNYEVLEKVLADADAKAGRDKGVYRAFYMTYGEAPSVKNYKSIVPNIARGCVKDEEPASVGVKDEEDYGGRTALHFAAGLEHEKCADLLIREGVNVDVMDKLKNTPLHYAAAYGSIMCTKLLEKQGANLIVQNIDGKTPLELAKSNNENPVAEFLQKKIKGDEEEDEDESEDGDLTIILYNASIGNVEGLKKALDDGSDRDEEDSGGMRPLHYACASGHVECAKLLLEVGALVDARDRKKKTALHHAICEGRKECVALLLENGATPYLQDNVGKTAFDLAKEKTLVTNPAKKKNHEDILDLLLIKSMEL